MLSAFWLGMLEALKGLLDVAGHGEINGAIDIVPFECNAAKRFAFPVERADVFAFEDLDEMVGMFFTNILDTEVVNNEAELDRAGLVGEEASNMFGLMVAVFC